MESYWDPEFEPNTIIDVAILSLVSIEDSLFVNRLEHAQLPNVSGVNVRWQRGM